MIKVLPALTLSAALAPLALGATTEFEACLGEIREQAVDQGIDPGTTDQVLDRVERLERVIELDRRQPEFTTPFSDYLNRRVTTQRIVQGRALLHAHRALLDRVHAETGVPPAYLLALWALETNYGNHFGSFFVPSALATLACDPRRASYFTGELIAALRIVEEEAIPLERMQGSWAGAMGHVQFMPSVFLQYAVDGDGDGRRDLWGSVPDAMMSAGNFLAGLGWDDAYRWGREVLLPQDFDYGQAGRSQRRALGEWRRQGVTDTSGQPVADLDIDAALLLPAGHRGPAFLVYDNFDVIMGWNRSEFFALTVGHLADRIAGGGRLHNPPPADAPRMSREQVIELQTALNAMGYDSGEVDGILGPATRNAIRAYQQAEGMIPDGFPDPILLARLDIDV
ncbi:lytic murein transglycosylase [Thioalkalivibrio paradoxus]|uniref:Lytic transglycosylase n=1 Tax=Thioalkalivibrio paradoxus ARh 1 TaxID=713585 RepID=W0DNX3_9GAMM|nr:lytic murein transglycosylase [Thioalkalivibrio paradoxus]AHE98962.1 lytic transglycosylase [Thioalkalivibrio paradoxus ARh 1]